MARWGGIACWLASGVALCACNRQPSAPTHGSGSSTPRDEVARNAEPAPQQAAVAQVPPPEVRIAAELSEGRLAVRVQNRAQERVVLGHALELERQSERGYAPVRARSEALALGAGKARCTELAAGAELRPEPWRVADLPGSGTYHFVAQACDGSYRVSGEPFELP